ncbi:16492_t:CDS:2 [Funneliformis caledonium]|uniref:16492_t:CDS:1 n=1 Tax=Funneliformis caledonium TaxID=1117310 RepID=A0A9N9DWU5_9GLOM|nr:16492_t:CDS:2 [Funneliformis caledonium]
MEKVEIHQVDHEFSSELLPIDSEFRLDNDKVDHNNEGCIDEMKLKEEPVKFYLRNLARNYYSSLKHQLMFCEINPEYVRSPVESSIGIIRFSIDHVEPSDLMQDKEVVSSSQKPKDLISSRAKKWHELPDDMKEESKTSTTIYSQNQSGSQLVKPGKDESELLTVDIPKFFLRPVIPIVTMTQIQYIDFAQHKLQMLER